MSGRILPAILTCLILLSIGCSGNGSTPVANDLTDGNHVMTHASGSTSLWGLWDVIYNPETSSIDVIPLRTLDLTVNVTLFMQPPSSASHLLTIQIDPTASDFTSGFVVVDVSFKHPFPGLDTYTGFDVRGVCIGDGDITGTHDSDVTYAGPENLQVVNADGHTRWYNQDEFTTFGTILGFTLGKMGTPTYDFTATLNGYKYFCDDLDNDENIAEFFNDSGCPNPRGYFTAGTQNTRRYELQFPVIGDVPQFDFQYAVVASWDQPDPDPPSDFNTDFPLSANCLEAYAFSTVDQSTLYYVDTGNWGGDINFDIAVYDHQGNDSPGGVHDQIARIHLESQNDLISGNLFTFEAADLTSSLIDSSEMLARYALTVPESSLNLSGTGDFPVLIVVESSSPIDYDQGLPGFDFANGALAGYFMTGVNVSGINPNDPPVAVADTVTGDYTGYTDIPIEFDGSESYDPDGTIVSWEWDFDEDGVYGDETGELVSYTWDTDGVFYVDLKVTDNDGATDTLDDLLEITISDKVIHVDVDNPGDPLEDGSLEHPFDRLQEGADAVPDDTGWSIYVHEGTYTDPLTLENPADPMNTPGGQFLLSALSNVLILAEDGVILDPPTNYTYQKAAIRLRSNCQDITIDNFVIDPSYAYQSAIWGDGGDGLIVQNCSLEPPNASYGFLEFLRCQNVSNVTAQNNTMDTFNSASTYMSVFVINGGSNVTITGNDVYKLNNWTGYNMYQTGEGYVAMYNVNGGEVSKNKFGGEHHRASPSTNYVHSYGVYISSGTNITVRNNLIYDTYYRDSSTGQSRNWAVWAIGTSSNLEIYNNTFDRVGPPATYSGPGYSFGIRIENTNSHTIHSNIITNITAPSTASAYGIHTAGSQSCDYGCVWGIDGGTVSALYGGGAYAGTGSISEDPMFSDPDNFDYTLQSGSPCEGTGMDGEDMGCYGGSDPLE